MQGEIVQRFTLGFSFPVLFTRDVFKHENPILRDVLRAAGPKRHRILLVVDSNVADADPDLLTRAASYVQAHSDIMEMAGPAFLIRGGEICKSDPVEVAAIHGLVEKHKIDRQSFIVAVGGGAVLDAVGYAAATAHRGVRLIRLPTTVLGQNDAGVGVKNGVNAFGRKNFIGTFAPPFAVTNDFDFLRTLPARDTRAGMAEAVKIAAIKDADFLAFLHKERKNLAVFQPEAVEHMISHCALRHIEHVGAADPFETGSARPLDFGHWAAHKLEELTGNELRHGEAVAIGCALDSIYAFHSGLLTEMELGKLLHTFEDIGFDLYHPALSRMDVEEALGQFQEHIGGDLTITLPNGLGKKIDIYQIDVPLMKRCIAALADRHHRHKDDRRSEKSEPLHCSKGSA